MGHKELWNIGWDGIRQLEVDRGILASGRDEAYGCIFGRDSLITALELLEVDKQGNTNHFLPLVKKILFHLSELQGTQNNIENGEEPGKIIHEYRPERHEHLTAALQNPWYVYSDGTMRNYDSVDSTPLYLMAFYRYIEASEDYTFLENKLPNVLSALQWLLQKGEDRFIEYSFPAERTYGGLRTQSWMDSGESLFYENSDEMPPYPIAPLEVQAYAWTALSMWSDSFKERDPLFGEKLSQRARVLKAKFNTTYVLKGSRSTVLAFAIDGAGRTLTAPRSSMGHVLWAAYKDECILDSAYIPGIAQRLLKPDLFVATAGVRTLSSRSSKFDPHSYHNGSIWPHDTAILAKGLENFGFIIETRRVRDALLRSYRHFRTPIELFAYHRGVREYQPLSGHRACRTQAWSAAGLLVTLAAEQDSF